MKKICQDCFYFRTFMWTNTDPYFYSELAVKNEVVGVCVRNYIDHNNTLRSTESGFKKLEDTNYSIVYTGYNFGCIGWKLR